MAIRLGRIGYVNMAPIFYRLDAEVDEVVGVPTELNRQLIAGDLDVAPISSIAYARAADRLRLLPRLCVSSEGAVESIQLISKTPLSRVRSIAVTPESATSVVLTRVLFPDAEHVPLEADAEARLLSGDAALRSAFEDPTPHHDLGRLWQERTGLPMVFAVWAAPEPTHPGLPECIRYSIATRTWFLLSVFQPIPSRMSWVSSSSSTGRKTASGQRRYASRNDIAEWIPNTRAS